MTATRGEPAIRVLSLGAGVQSSVLLLLAASGRIPRPDVAVFADTQWEPAAVYRHLQRLRPIAEQAGIELVTVSAGNIRTDATDPESRFASMPMFTLGPQGQRGMARRQCTSQYKINCIKREVRRRLGYVHPVRVPAGVHAVMQVGISLDEIGRARDSDVRYMVNSFPLLDMAWRREDCVRHLEANGLPDTPRSSCVGCPYHDDAFWHDLKVNSPEEWQQAVEFDHAIRHGSARANANGHPLRGQFFLHASRVPLDEVVLRPKAKQPYLGGCGPFACASGVSASEGVA
ncbi:hypothetical protein [Longispora albida]|uniref:hypothetical protein n=1 Tax=Longispora albida TaxID=203523 RepID=UPI00037FA94A|nr:hypothetical protein [Longispora albida]